MLRAGVNDKERPLILMGLSEGNIVRLKNGQPIKAEIRSLRGRPGGGRPS